MTVGKEQIGSTDGMSVLLSCRISKHSRGTGHKGERREGDDGLSELIPKFRERFVFRIGLIWATPVA